MMAAAVHNLHFCRRMEASTSSSSGEAPAVGESPGSISARQTACRGVSRFGTFAVPEILLPARWSLGRKSKSDGSLEGLSKVLYRLRWLGFWNKAIVLGPFCGTSASEISMRSLRSRGESEIQHWRIRLVTDLQAFLMFLFRLCNSAKKPLDRRQFLSIVEAGLQQHERNCRQRQSGSGKVICIWQCKKG